MNELPTKEHHQDFEARLRGLAKALSYPPTPDIASAVRARLGADDGVQRPRQLRRRLAWGMAALALLLVVTLAVPPVRAALREAIQLGAIRIFLGEATETPSPTPTSATPVSTDQAASRPTGTSTPHPTPLTSPLDLAGETTLEEARAQAGFEIRLPSYPLDLGPPDHVFMQTMGDVRTVILVWLEPDRPGEVRLSLHQLGAGNYAFKGAERLEETSVNGQRALWIEGPHIYQLESGAQDLRLLVEGNVLVWSEGAVTYRIESSLPREEILRIAESLR